MGTDVPTVSGPNTSTCMMPTCSLMLSAGMANRALFAGRNVARRNRPFVGGVKFVLGHAIGCTGDKVSVASRANSAFMIVTSDIRGPLEHRPLTDQEAYDLLHAAIALLGNPMCETVHAKSAIDAAVLALQTLQYAMLMATENASAPRSQPPEQ